MSNANPVLYDPSSEDSRRSVMETIVKTRKSWKTMKGGRGGEAVWPPELEYALIEGLWKYKESGGTVKSTKGPGRFPMRNKLVSDYIFRATGQYRKPKQVGSRVQQLRDTPGGRQLLKLVSQDESPNADPAEDSINEEPSLSQDATASSSLPRLCTSALPLANEELSPALLSPLSSNPGLTLESPFPPTNSRMLLGHTTPSHKLPPRAHIQIDILSDFHPDAAFNFRAYDGMEKASNLPISHFSCASLEDITVYKPPSDPVSLRYLDPTVTIALPFHLNAYSAFYVYLDEERAPIHTELASLISTRPEGSSSGPMSYSTTLVPIYWSTLCASEEPSRYTVVQEILRYADISTSSQAQLSPSEPTVMFSAVYKFQYAAMSDTSSSRPSTSASDFSSIGSFSPHSSFLHDILEAPVDSSRLQIQEPAVSDFDHLSLFDQPFEFPQGDHQSPYVLLGSQSEFDVDKTVRASVGSVPVSPLSACFPSSLSNYV